LKQFFASQAISSPVEEKLTMPHSLRRLHKLYSNSQDRPTNLAWSTFRRIWKQHFKSNFRKAKHRDGLCQLCEIAHKIDNTVPNWQKLTVQRHKLSNEQIKKQYDSQVNNLQPKTGILIFDFKENVTLGVGPRELGQSWYTKERRTIFGLVLLVKDPEGGVLRWHFNCVSSCLSHDAIFVSQVLDSLMDTDVWKSFELSHLSIWSDNGPHFRNKILIRYSSSYLKLI
jgi:hypothetical protein